MATKANLIIDKGTSYSTSIDVLDEYGNPIDLTYFIGSAQLRKHYTSTGAVDFAVDLDGADGTIYLSLSANVTANLIPGRYVYDVELISSDGIVSRLVEGIATITPNVTR